MPIRPEMKHLYPPPKEWRAIRHRILVRAHDACECAGECGLEHEFEGHDPTHNDDVNLRALCQLCHLRYDRHEHAKNAAMTRARRRDERSGQTSLRLERAS